VAGTSPTPVDETLLPSLLLDKAEDDELAVESEGQIDLILGTITMGQQVVIEINRIHHSLV
jgi:hypothetical protein